MLILYVIGLLIGIIIIYLGIVIFSPGFHVPKQPLSGLKSGAKEKSKESPLSRKDVSFKVEGMLVKAWLYLPVDVSVPVPCIVMNHGFGGTRDWILENYAIRFQDAGMAVLTYDYRHFGDSEGEPRQLFAIKSQLEDCSAAVDYVRSRTEIDSNKIAVWGTSAGGGYGLAIAAKDKKIACVCTQVVGLDSKEDGKLALKREGLRFILRLVMHAQRDKGRSRFGLSAHKIPIVGKPGTLAMIIASGAYEGYAKLAKAGFVNEVCARAILTTGGYNPVNYTKDVHCPVLIQVCENDNLVSVKSAQKVVEILGEKAEIKRYPIGHFDIYTGDHFEQPVRDQIEFFKKHLK
ncbi:MAG: alpha/beta hydrolase [Calditrichia bacterium]|nr:alpha/beta hydrolase [Calditrichia bacterium]